MEGFSRQVMPTLENESTSGFETVSAGTPGRSWPDTTTSSSADVAVGDSVRSVGELVVGADSAVGAAEDVAVEGAVGAAEGVVADAEPSESTPSVPSGSAWPLMPTTASPSGSTTE